MIEKVKFLSEVSTEYTFFVMKRSLNYQEGKKENKSFISVKSHVIICHFIRRHLVPQPPYVCIHISFKVIPNWYKILTDFLLGIFEELIGVIGEPL